MTVVACLGKFRADGATTVGSTSQIGAAVTVGMMIGALMPVAGFLISFGVGLAVGLGMIISVEKDKTVCDVIADVGEGAWNFMKGLFG
ncbi:MAG: hypothetical protein Q4D89_14495 [Arachnia propionica]|uniref:hypothetical protein n=1 Tax=Arachnia propionica TaxID=1750 RepID=UPI0027025A76|nr:hypothetical protein [Arachnia propionica]